MARKKTSKKLPPVKPKKRQKAVVPPVQTEPEIKPEPKPETVGADEDFFADPRRERALDMLLNGMPKKHIADTLGVHRNTINNWCSDSRFVEAANKRVREHQASKRLRRMMATGAITDVTEGLTAKAITVIQKHMEDGKTVLDKEVGQGMRFFRELAYEYRAFREEERKDFGDDIKRVQVQGSHNVTGEITVVQSVDNIPFRDYMKKAIDDGVIDVEEIQGDNNGQLLLKAAEHMLVDTDLLEDIEREDREAEAVTRGEESLTKKDPMVHR